MDELTINYHVHYEFLHLNALNQNKTYLWTPKIINIYYLSLIFYHHYNNNELMIFEGVQVVMLKYCIHYRISLCLLDHIPSPRLD
jgi:hypothetical protein